MNGIETQGGKGGPYTFTIGIIEGLQFNNVWMPDNPHYLQLTILIMVSSSPHAVSGAVDARVTNLEPFVLEYSFDGSILSTGRQLCLKHDTEGTIANDFALGILHFSSLAGESILYLFSYHFYNGMSAHVLEQRPLSSMRNQGGREERTAHAQARKDSSRPVLRHRRVLRECGIHFGD